MYCHVPHINEQYRLLHGYWEIHNSRPHRRIILDLAAQIISHASLEERYIHDLYRDRLSGLDGPTYYEDRHAALIPFASTVYDYT